jgi:hypothetical protein
MILKCISAAIFFIACCQPIAMASDATLPLQQRVGILERLIEERPDLTDTEFAQRIALVFSELQFSVDVARVSKLKNVELDQLFGALTFAALYTGEASYVPQMRQTLEEIERREIMSPNQILAMHKAYILSRDFNAAQELSARHQHHDMDRIPTFTSVVRSDYTGPTAWAVENGQHLVRKQVQAATGVLVIAHPGCRVSRNAVRAILDSPTATQIFAKTAVWLVPHAAELPLQMIRDWNENHSDIGALMIPHSRDEWPQVDYWGTPAFYFLRDGIVVEKVIGWPEERQIDELLHAASSADLVQ